MQLTERFERLFHTVRSPQLLENRLEKLVGEVRANQPVPMRLRLWSGRSYELGPDPVVTLTVPKPAALRYLLAPDLMKLGEAYVEGHIELDGPIHEVFRVAERFATAAGTAHAPAPQIRYRRHRKAQDRAAIEYHYDVSNEFYSLFLDRNMVYSCAYFKTETDTLEAAQEQKLDHILTKLRLAPGERLLDIGCGWGALVFRAVEKFGARAVGITLSKNQYEYAQEKIREKGIGDRCEVRLQDYRDVPEEGGFDKISSVGMFEHVGLKNLELYFRRMRALLKDGGLMLNHGITSVDPDSRSVGRGAGDFIDKYVFPDGELPHIGLVLREMSAAGLETVDLESLRRHYAKTTAIWADRLEANRDRARSIAGEKRCRIWSIYLAGCAFGFAHDWINIYQALACKADGAGANPLPLTRDYMYR
jgi:cyclopropane-fatty-acyl-phospholipid synthase